jgi:hypothetical protein
MIVDALVEGLLDEAAARKLIRHAGHEFGICFGKAGAGTIRRTLPGFNARARWGDPLLVLVDQMDTGADCPPEFVATWLPERCDKLLLRAVVRELESWLLADRAGMAAFLGVSEALIPRDPEALPNPKETLVNLARRSRRRIIRDWMLPAEGSRHPIGSGYTLAMEEFTLRKWDVDAAAERAKSLRRCIARLCAI